MAVYARLPIQRRKDLPALEAELATLRRRVTRQQAIVTELRTALEQLSFPGRSWPRRFAMAVGFVAGLAGALAGAAALVALVSR
jgi:hypothetical protein